MIIFKTIRWKNFLSTGDAFIEIDLNKSSTTLIVGENGAGKSTVLDALTFGLFGKPFRKVNIPQLVNSVNGKHTLVEVEFRIGRKKFLIRRGLKPKVFEIFKNGQLLNQSATSRDYQSILEKTILKLNYKSFTQIVVLGNSSFVPFMQLPAAHRREVIEDLLDIQIFSTMNVLLKERQQTNKESTKDNDYQINISTEKTNLQESHIKSIMSNNEKKIKQNEREIQKTKKQIVRHEASVARLMTKISVLSAGITDESKLRSKRSQMADIDKQLATKIRRLKKDLDFFTDNEHCPTCDQDISVSFREERTYHSNNKLVVTKDGREQLHSQQSIIINRLDEIATIIQEITEKQQKVSIEQNSISALSTYTSKVKKDIEQLKTNKEDVEKEKIKLKTFKKDLKIHQKEKEKLVDEVFILDIAGTLLKDTGIKTSIIKKYVPKINKLIQKYLAAMDFFVNFELDESFNETVKSRHCDDFSYTSFSEGEKMRIDLALLFCWRSIAKMKNSTNTNLLMFDEVFDASLDGTGCEEFLKLIQTLGKNTNIFVISHKGDVLTDKFDDTVRFGKVKNFSRII